MKMKQLQATFSDHAHNSRTAGGCWGYTVYLLVSVLAKVLDRPLNSALSLDCQLHLTYSRVANAMPEPTGR